jgi:2-oxo-4-hydroxy-4-carboxy-5-ureidoimidazoline decarboxylase
MQRTTALHGSGWFGSAVPLRRFNRVPPAEAVELLQQCLPVDRWVQTVAAARPYRHLDDLFEVAREAAFPFAPAELEAALAALKVPTVVPPERRRETAVEARLREQIVAGVKHYQQRFGRPFLIHAEGKTGAQILVQLWERLSHDLDTEDDILAQQIRQNALLILADTISG